MNTHLNLKDHCSGLCFMVKCTLLLFHALWLPSCPTVFLSKLVKLFISAVLCVLLCTFILPLSVPFRVVEDVPLGLNDVLLLLEVHLQHSLNQHERDPTL